MYVFIVIYVKFFVLYNLPVLQNFYEFFVKKNLNFTERPNLCVELSFYWGIFNWLSVAEERKYQVIHSIEFCNEYQVLMINMFTCT